MKTPTVKQLAPRVRPILRKYAVKRAAFFGSLARGSATPKSDVDIVVEFGKEKTLLDLVQLKNALEERLKKKVDVVTYRSLRARFKEQVLRDEVSIV